MSLRRETPCDWGECPYSAMYNCDCEYWCGADESEDNPADWEDDVDECGYNPYMGCYDDDC